jgi:hypothetical protein
MVRRLHDTGRNGYFTFISLIPPFGVIGLILALVEQGESFENEFGPVTDAAKAEKAAKSRAELSLKEQLKRSVKPVETAIRVNLYSPLPSFRFCDHRHHLYPEYRLGEFLL